MWGMDENPRVFLCLGVTDMRKSINGLSVLVEHELDGNLGQGDLFVFCNRSRKIVKVLYWAKNGFCLWQKRLEKSRFKWPANDDEIQEIDDFALGWLLEGLDIRQAHEKLLTPKSV